MLIGNYFQKLRILMSDCCKLVQHFIGKCQWLNWNSDTVDKVLCGYFTHTYIYIMFSLFLEQMFTDRWSVFTS